jgi:hypothetical protein
MEVELRTEGEMGERLRAVLDAQLERLSQRAPENAELTVEQRIAA